jgi:hypothetical protein
MENEISELTIQINKLKKELDPLLKKRRQLKKNIFSHIYYNKNKKAS